MLADAPPVRIPQIARPAAGRSRPGPIFFWPLSRGAKLALRSEGVKRYRDGFYMIRTLERDAIFTGTFVITHSQQA